MPRSTIEVGSRTCLFSGDAAVHQGYEQLDGCRAHQLDGLAYGAQRSVVRAASGMSSNPITETSPGTSKPISWAASIAPMADRSFPAETAVGRSGRERSSMAGWCAASRR